MSVYLIRRYGHGVRLSTTLNHALVAAGKSVFARAGTNAPLEEVGGEAGVGRGTLYRHFPTREHLFMAIMKERVDELDARAKQLLDAPDAWSASRWPCAGSYTATGCPTAM